MNGITTDRKVKFGPELNEEQKAQMEALAQRRYAEHEVEYRKRLATEEIEKIVHRLRSYADDVERDGSRLFRESEYSSPSDNAERIVYTVLQALPFNIRVDLLLKDVRMYEAAKVRLEAMNAEEA